MKNRRYIGKNEAIIPTQSEKSSLRREKSNKNPYAEVRNYHCVGRNRTKIPTQENWIKLHTQNSEMTSAYNEIGESCIRRT